MRAKKLILLLLFLCLLCLIACDSNTTNPLTGTWSGTVYFYDSSDNPIGSDSCTIVFKDGGTGTMTRGSESTSIEWAFVESKIRITAGTDVALVEYSLTTDSLILEYKYEEGRTVYNLSK